MDKEPLLPSRGYAKLDSCIVDSSLWLKDHDVLRVWIAFLAKADARGRVRAAVPAMAHLCLVTVDRFEEIVADLESPDPYSRNPDNDGIRLTRVPGGWIINNYSLYRAQHNDPTGAERQRRYRERNRNVTCHDVTSSVTSVTQAEAEAEAEAIKKKVKKKDRVTSLAKIDDAPPFTDEMVASELFQEAWSTWIAYLKEKRKNPPPTTVVYQLRKLSKYSIADAIESINQSIAGGYQGLFPEKVAANRPKSVRNRSQELLEGLDDE